jgi:hypothetical protein
MHSVRSAALGPMASAGVYRASVADIARNPIGGMATDHMTSKYD